MKIDQITESKDMCSVCGQTPCNCTGIKEEKVRLDPACWHNKKIGNPKTKVKGGVRVNNCVPKEGVNEHIDDGDWDAEYDDEAGMADNNLETLRRAVDGIDELIQPGDNLPEWCQEKIAKAEQMLVGVWDYMRSEQDRGAAHLERQIGSNEDTVSRIKNLAGLSNDNK